MYFWAIAIAISLMLWAGFIYFFNPVKFAKSVAAGRREVANQRVSRSYVLGWQFRNRWHKGRLERELQELNRRAGTGTKA